MRVLPHQIPNEAGAVILDHEDGGPLVDSEMKRRYPNRRSNGPLRDRGVECRLETIRVVLAQLQGLEIPQRGLNNIRHKRKRGGYHPRCKAAIDGTPGRATSLVTEEAP